MCPDFYEESLGFGFWRIENSHLLILLFIAMAHGSAFPFTKLVLNDSVPPILMASLRMGLVLTILIPFWRFKIPEKKYIPSLIAFSISMGVMVYVFMTLALYYSSIIFFISFHNFLCLNKHFIISWCVIFLFSSSFSFIDSYI